MSPLPHYFGLDFSGAGPWLLAGFLAGLLLSWIWRALLGSRIGAKAQAKINEIEALLDTSRKEHQADVTRLLSDARNYEQALADAERRAAAHSENVARLKAENEKLSRVELNSRDQLLAADAELTKLRSGLQWAQSQAQGAAQDRQALEQQIIRLRSEHQTFSAELATARTALELKDAEIARLINQSRWHESRVSALEKEKLGLTGSLTALSAKDAELAQAQHALAGLQSSSAEALNAAQAKYDTTWKDLTYMRNLAYWQTSEIERLRKAITQFEADVAAKSSDLTALTQQYAHLKARLSKRSLVGRAKGPSYDARSGAEGPTAAAASGKIAYLYPRSSGPFGKKPMRAKAYKLGKAVAAAGPAGQAAVARGPQAKSGAGILAARRIAFAELQSLRAKVARLSEEAANYRLLREALDTANRIAGTAG